ncbi:MULTISPECIES: alpha/beta fold hydrolase [Paenibacillus]|uniref:alpha/beta fold hydrolase n=1 Tax=Paenibacillus TaxID=44249 RepID=UPI00117C5354|nr:MULTISPECIES: alpha/beta hydrolase [Paenibacillus]
MTINKTGATLPGISHHYAEVNGTKLHYVSAGTTGTPILLVHGFPETWWTFRKLIPLLADNHRVFAVDLRGFGDSDNAPGQYDSKTSAEDLHLLIKELNVGPVHLTGQDISGATILRLAATHPEDVLSFTAIEMGLPGFGLEMLADVTHGGTWYIGVLAAPKIPEMLLSGREREFLGQFIFPTLSATPRAITEADIDEFVRTYSRPNGWRGAIGLYQSMLQEGEDIAALASAHKLSMPVLAIGAGGGEFTFATMSQVASGEVQSVSLDGVGHYAALEAPEKVAVALLDFFDSMDTASLESEK